MSNSELAIKAKEIWELQRIKEELEAEITTLQDDIKAMMMARGVDELTA